MRTYWFKLAAFAALVSASLYHYQARPFSETEWTSKWDGGPDRNSKEYYASIASGQEIARQRKSAAPLQAAVAFAFLMGLGALLAVRRARKGK
jgi:hypothetical protein